MVSYRIMLAMREGILKVAGRGIAVTDMEVRQYSGETPGYPQQQPNPKKGFTSRYGNSSYFLGHEQTLSPCQITGAYLQHPEISTTSI